MNSNLHIVFDTNIIKKTSDIDYRRFELNETFTIVHDFIVGNRLENIKLYIPQICLDELLIQYAEGYKKIKEEIELNFDTISAKANVINWRVEIEKNDDFNFKDYLSRITDFATRYIENFSSAILIPNCKNECMPSIIRKALDRQKPFFKGKYGKKEFSDAGFKDVVFIESIKEFFCDNTDEIMIFTGDDIINEINVKKEFVGKTITIKKFDRGVEIKNMLCDKFEITDLSQQYDFCSSSYYTEVIENDLKCKVVNPVVSIEKEENEYTYYRIETIIEKGCKTIPIYVKINEVNDFDEAQLQDTCEVIYTW